MWSFAKLGGGRVSDGSKMPNFYFGKVFFQLACRIILGPPKHVLHLVWSVLGISTAIKTALKVALDDFFDGPPTPFDGQSMEKVNRSMGPDVSESKTMCRLN